MTLTHAPEDLRLGRRRPAYTSATHVFTLPAMISAIVFALFGPGPRQLFERLHHPASAGGIHPVAGVALPRLRSRDPEARQHSRAGLDSARRPCRSCGTAIAWRYPVVEISTAALFVLCRLNFGPRGVSFGWATLCFLLLGLAVMDMETMLLPNWFTVPGIVLGLLFAAWVPRPAESAGGRVAAELQGFLGALLHAGIAAAFLLGIMGLYWLVRRRAGMGMGDVKLLAMIAAWLGLPQTALVFAPGRALRCSLGGGDAGPQQKRRPGPLEPSLRRISCACRDLLHFSRRADDALVCAFSELTSRSRPA